MPPMVEKCMNSMEVYENKVSGPESIDEYSKNGAVIILRIHHGREWEHPCADEVYNDPNAALSEMQFNSHAESDVVAVIRDYLLDRGKIYRESLKSTEARAVELKALSIRNAGQIEDLPFA